MNTLKSTSLKSVSVLSSEENHAVELLLSGNKQAAEKYIDGHVVRVDVVEDHIAKLRKTLDTAVHTAAVEVLNMLRESEVWRIDDALDGRNSAFAPGNR